jgi:hypothetical protein
MSSFFKEMIYYVFQEQSPRAMPGVHIALRSSTRAHSAVMLGKGDSNGPSNPSNIADICFCSSWIVQAGFCPCRIKISGFCVFWRLYSIRYTVLGVHRILFCQISDRPDILPIESRIPDIRYMPDTGNPARFSTQYILVSVE